MKVHEEIGHFSNVPMSWFWCGFEVYFWAGSLSVCQSQREDHVETALCGARNFIARAPRLAHGCTWWRFVKWNPWEFRGPEVRFKIRMLYDSLMTMSQYDCTPWVLLKARQLLSIAFLSLARSAKCQPGTGTGWVWWQSCHMGGGRKELRASGSCRYFFKFQKTQEICCLRPTLW